MPNVMNMRRNVMMMVMTNMTMMMTVMVYSTPRWYLTPLGTLAN